MWLGDRAIFIRQHGVSRQKAKWRQCTAEHLNPKSEGGPNSRVNIVAACLFCNQMRHRVANPPQPHVYQGVVRRLVREGLWHSRRAFEALVAHLINPPVGT
jgi:hypothetical protein